MELSSIFEIELKEITKCINDMIASLDYKLKKKKKNWWNFLLSLNKKSRMILENNIIFEESLRDICNYVFLKYFNLFEV